MGWNEPGDGKDPWGKPPAPRPPDLEAFFQRLRKRFGARRPAPNPGASVGAIFVALVILWGLTGLYTVEPQEQGIVLQLGRYVATTGQGMHWHLPYPVERVKKVRTGEASLTEHLVLLTSEADILAMDVMIDYHISDATAFAFNLADPTSTLKEALEAAVRQAVGAARLDEDNLLDAARSEVPRRAQALMQATLDNSASGLQLSALKFQNVSPPEPLRPGFDEVRQAREDALKKKSDAQSYASGILPQARADAARQTQEADAYRERVVERAKGDVARFSAVLAEYQKAPQVTRKRMYFDAMESVLSRTSKIVLDARKGGNGAVLTLPLDQLRRHDLTPPPVQPKAGAAAAPASAPAPAPAPAPKPGAPSQEQLRSRERSQ